MGKVVHLDVKAVPKTSIPQDLMRLTRWDQDLGRLYFCRPLTEKEMSRTILAFGAPMTFEERNQRYGNNT
jgi:hypothetical protein